MIFDRAVSTKKIVVKIELTLLVQSDNELSSPMTVLHDACVGSEICFQGRLDHQSAPNSMGNRRFNHSVVAVVCNVQKEVDGNIVTFDLI